MLIKLGTSIPAEHEPTVLRGRHLQRRLQRPHAAGQRRHGLPAGPAVVRVRAHGPEQRISRRVPGAGAATANRPDSSRTRSSWSPPQGQSVRCGQCRRPRPEPDLLAVGEARHAPLVGQPVHHPQAAAALRAPGRRPLRRAGSVDRSVTPTSSTPSATATVRVTSLRPCSTALVTSSLTSSSASERRWLEVPQLRRWRRTRAPRRLPRVVAQLRASAPGTCYGSPPARTPGPLPALAVTPADRCDGLRSRACAAVAGRAASPWRP